MRSLLYTAIVAALVNIACAAAAGNGVVVASASDPAWAFPPNYKSDRPTATDKTETLPGSTQTFSPADLVNRTSAVDWFPGDHPAMPAAVRGGHGTVYACGYCHLPEGNGRTENAALAGMPFDYLQRQVYEMKTGARRLIDPRFIPGDYMLTTVSETSSADIDAALRYFSALTYVKHVRVIEAATIPHVRADGYLYVFDDATRTESLGERIVEGPDDVQAFEKRDPRTRFTAYVPLGAIARGAALANGEGGAKVACATCHGPGLKGGALGPPIAGRYPTGLFRQLYAFQTGTRNGSQAVWMKPIVTPLTQTDMIDLAAYVASLDP